MEYEDKDNMKKTSKNKGSNMKKTSKYGDNMKEVFKDEANNIKEASKNKRNIVKETFQDKDNMKKAFRFVDNNMEEVSKNRNNMEEEPESKDSNTKDASENESSNIMEMSSDEDNNTEEAFKDIGNNVKEVSKDRDNMKKSKDDYVEAEHCSDATYLARKMTSMERLSYLDSKKLFDLCVQLRHIVPPQHNIETRAGSHMPSREQIERFEKIVPLKKGSYSVEEDKIIVRNWKEFCKLHDWDMKNPKAFLQLRIGTKTYMRNTTERRKFVQFLANGLPNRTLYSVYHRFRNLYESNVTRRYKPEEDEMIIDHLENNPSLDEKRKYADLAKVLRRTRNSIWRRYRILKKRNKKLRNI